MKRFLMTIALSCVLSGSALAGDIPTGGIAQPPTGDIPTAGFAQQAEDALLGGFLAVVGWLI